MSGTTGRQPYRASLAVAQAVPDERHRALRYLWARTVINNDDAVIPLAHAGNDARNHLRLVIGRDHHPYARARLGLHV